MPCVAVADEAVAKFRRGQPILGASAAVTAAFNREGELVAICEPKEGRLHPVKVIPPTG
jgi:hypothetical protein